MAVRVRASSVSELMDCPARWEAKQIKGMKLPSSPAAWIGTSLHKSTAAFDRGVLVGSPISIDDAAGVYVDSLRKPDADIDWKADDDITPGSAEAVGLKLHTAYCAKIAPARTYTAVEVTIPSMIVDVAGVQIELTGTADRIRMTLDGDLGVSDFKSGKRAASVQKGNGAQMGVYSLLAEHAIGKPVRAPAEIIGLQTTKTPSTATFSIPNVREKLIGDGTTPGILEQAALYLKSGVFPANPRSMLCAEKYCPLWATCKFHD